MECHKKRFGAFSDASRNVQIEETAKLIRKGFGFSLALKTTIGESEIKRKYVVASTEYQKAVADRAELEVYRLSSPAVIIRRAANKIKNPSF